MEFLSEEKLKRQKRICFLDELRGVAVILMILYHALYSMTFIFNIEAVYPVMRAVYPYEPVIPIIFITICGTVCSFSRNNLKRGIKICSCTCIGDTWLILMIISSFFFC